MEFLFGLIVEFVLAWSVYDTDDNKIPKWIRIGLLILTIVIYIVFIIYLIFEFFSLENTFIKVIVAGAIVFFGGLLISLWRRVMKAKK